MDAFTLLFALPIALAIVLGAGALTGVAEVDVEVDADVEVDGDAADSILALLGVGRAPLGVLLATALLTFGTTGLGLKAFASPWLALGVALLAAPVAMATLGRLLGRHLPTSESYAVGASDLIGRSGIVRLRVAEDFGIAQVRDAHGSLHEIRCRAESPVEAGAEIVVVGHDGERFEVTSLEALSPADWA